MKATIKQKGPWTHRVLVFLFSALLGVLIYWLLGFVVRDIGTWPGPNYQEVQSRLLDPQVVKEKESLDTQAEEVTRAIENRRQRQTVLRDSSTNSERTMNQPLSVQYIPATGRGVMPAK